MKHIKNIDFLRRPFKVSYKNKFSGSDWNCFHAHQGLEFLYIHEGHGTMILDNKLHDLKPGALFVFQPYQLHRVSVRIDTDNNYERSMILFEPSIFYDSLENFPVTRDFFRKVWKKRLTTQVIDKISDEAYLSCLLRNFSCTLQEAAPKDKPEVFTVFLLQFLQFIKPYLDAEDMGYNSSGHTGAGSHVEKIMEWIDRNFKEEFHLDKLAGEFHLSGYYISHLFQKATGASITEFLTARRIKEACLLLQTTDYPLQRIAENIGITNPSYFCQMFKKSMGISPHQYRLNK